MSNIAIKVENLGKKYLIKHNANSSGDGLRHFIEDSFGHALRVLTGKAGAREGESCSRSEEFWALRDVSFEVKKGEILGIIGRNGAGKSTLLKVLSRITEMSTGRIGTNGRVASLLEVGTGFHPELTGRENIFLNGAILGMSRSEVKQKFDEIVDFSGVERFLDTPVKRYSSGMYVRLAFAVAAHLEPEILIIDEVLAVGDADFQKKCLGKMKEVADGGGRTVLFVSHNMEAISRLCPNVLIMNKGQSSPIQPTEQGLAEYYGSNAADADTAGGFDAIHSRKNDPSVSAPMIVGLSLESRGLEAMTLKAGDPLTVTLRTSGDDDFSKMFSSIIIKNHLGVRVVMFHSFYNSGVSYESKDQPTMVCQIDSLPLTPGDYFIDIGIGDGEATLLEYIEDAARFTVTFGDLFNTGKIPSYRQGNVALPATWSQQ